MCQRACYIACKTSRERWCGVCGRGSAVHAGARAAAGQGQRQDHGHAAGDDRARDPAHPGGPRRPHQKGTPSLPLQHLFSACHSTFLHAQSMQQSPDVHSFTVTRKIIGNMTGGCCFFLASVGAPQGTQDEEGPGPCDMLPGSFMCASSIL